MHPKNRFIFCRSPRIQRSHEEIQQIRILRKISRFPPAFIHIQVCKFRFERRHVNYTWGSKTQSKIAGRVLSDFRLHSYGILKEHYLGILYMCIPCSFNRCLDMVSCCFVIKHELELEQLGCVNMQTDHQKHKWVLLSNAWAHRLRMKEFDLIPPL